jgi:nucleoside-diphosphate-sugar epimerase
LRVFVAGATGALGRPLTRALVARGHTVIGLTRDAARTQLIEADGGHAVVGDALDAATMRRLIDEAGPTDVVHALTALPPGGPLRARDLHATNRLRIDGTRHLLEAAVAAGARRFVGESFMGVYGDGAAEWRDEEEPLGAPAPGAFHDAIVALRDLESRLLEARTQGRIETVSLRFGGFYGPGVGSTEQLLKQVRAGWAFAPADDRGLLSFVHVDDAAAAVVAALEHLSPGPVYNVADETPMSVTSVMTQAARLLRARPPRRMPRWALRLLAPLAAELTSARLALATARVRRELGWRPQFVDVGEGLRTLVNQAGRPA